MIFRNKENKLPSSFAWLNISQFFGALNDNLFKLLLIFFLAQERGNEEPTGIIAAAAVTFVLPFILFSHAGGVLADRFSKQIIFAAGRGLEIAAMLVGCAGIYLASPFLLFSALFLTCSFSALTSPSKYGIIPELVKDDQLSRANGLIVAYTYAAIILGTFLPSFLLLKVFNKNFLYLSAVCVAVAMAGFGAATRIKKTKPAGVNTSFSLFFLKDIFATVRKLRANIYLYLAVLGSAFFMFIGSFIQSNAIVYCREILNWDWIRSGYLFPIAALGIGAGGLMAGTLSGRNIEFGIVPIGAFGLGLSCIFMMLIPSSVYYAAFVFFLMGMCSGLFTVPLNAFIQYESPDEQRGEILACSNFIGFLAVILSAGFFYVVNSVVGPALAFLSVGILTFSLMAVSMIILPDFLFRFMALILVRCVYRLKIKGIHNLPVKGGALLVSNHVTWVDALLLTATTQRRIRFIMAREIYEIKFLKPLFKLMKVIPISPADSPRRIIHSIREARKAMEDGFIVCIFAEGSVTRNGNMNRFRPGMEKILEGTSFPVIPVYIGGAWGSIFSYKYGKLASRLPTRIPYPITIIFGEQMPSSATTDQAEEAVALLSVEYFHSLKSRKRTLQNVFLDTARRFWCREAVSDSSGKRFSYGKLLISAIALANELKHFCGKNEKMVGVILPPSVGGVVANLGVLFSGRVPVNINFTTSLGSVESAIRQCEIKHVISSRVFMEKMPVFKSLSEIIFIEDLIATMGLSTKVRAIIKALFWPSRFLFRRGITCESPATIIFSSGSTGEPKGAMLTHHNIISNVEAFAGVFSFTREDKICGILPFFHSFGFTCTLWCPLLQKVKVCYHPNPLEAEKIGNLLQSERATVIMATPTFLLAYIRKVPKEKFSTLRAVIVGAEKLKKKIADSFEEKFGFRPLEGYGTTELSPVVAVNLPDVEIDGVKHVGRKDGSVGHPIIGIVPRVVHPETKEILPREKEGLLLIKGPNVMAGYLNKPEHTAEVLQDGWYNTGDIAKIDRDGFIHILDRLSRYSKIGGEMVPHIAVEEKYHSLLGSIGHVLAITAVPDEKKGEQLVVIHTLEAGTSEQLDALITASDLPNLWKPKKDNYFMVDALPLLGSGKLDLKRLKEMALSFVARKNSADTK